MHCIKYIYVFAILTGIILIGYFTRFYNLENNEVWDADAGYYSVYIDKYYKIIKIALSCKLKTILENQRKNNPELGLPDHLRQLPQNEEFKKLCSTIPHTDTIWPGHAAKPAHIISGTILKFFINKQNTLLYLTAIFSFLLVPFTFIVCYVFNKKAGFAILAMFLVAMSPMLSGYGRIGYSNIVSSFFLLIFFLLYEKSLFTEDIFYSILYLFFSGVFMAVAMLFHPSMMIWFMFVCFFELIVNYNQWKALIHRIFHLSVGFSIIIIGVELLHSYGFTLAYILSGATVKPYLYEVLRHSSAPPESDLFFYLKAITMYEGIIFVISTIGSSLYIFRYFRKDRKRYIWLYFSVIPFLFFSIFSFKFYIALRNITPILVPTYILIADMLTRITRNFLSNRDMKKLYLCIILIIIHCIYAAKTNFDNANIKANFPEIYQFVKNSGLNLVVPEHDYFLPTIIMGSFVPNKFSSNKNYLYFYRGNEKYPKETGPGGKIFMNNIYNCKLFALEHPKTLNLWISGKKMDLYNRIIISDNILQ